MSLPTLKKIQDIHKKIDQLKEEHAKLQSLLEEKIITLLHEHDAFSYDIEDLLKGITFVLHTLKSHDDASQKIRDSWQNIKGTTPQRLPKRKAA